MSEPQPPQTTEPTEQQPERQPGAVARISGALSKHWKVAAVGAVAVVSAVLLAAWSLFADRQAEYHAQFQQALELLAEENPAARDQAREIAKRLAEAGYRDPGFPGGLEFIVGMAAFHDAVELDAPGRYLIAARELQRAERLVLNDSRRPEWAYALGTSLYELQKPAAARPLLEDAVETYRPGREDAMIRLIDIYLGQRDPELLKKALKLNTELLNRRRLDRERDAAYLRSARIHLALGHKDEARQALAELSEAARKTESAILIQAQIGMFEAAEQMTEFRRLLDQGDQSAGQASDVPAGQNPSAPGRTGPAEPSLTEQAMRHKKAAEALYRQVIRDLQPIARRTALEQGIANQARFLIGRCTEAVGDTDAALKLFEQLADEEDASPESLAANVHAGDLLRRMGRNEEALNKRYRRVLQSIGPPEDFRNRWLSFEELRGRILAAWNDWIEEHAYQEAVELSGMMSSLIGPLEAQKLTARSYERWAEHLEARLASTPWSGRPPLQRQLRERQRLAGQTYARLADSLRASAEYGELLRLSAEYYTAGHDFKRALSQWTRYIRTRPAGRLPEAIFRRAQVLMDLDRLDEAAEQFQRVIDDYPTSPAAFDAEYTIGRCHLERNKPQQAERAWRAILTSESLTPEAKQWQLALVSLGRLLYHSAELKMLRADSPGSELSPEKRDELLAEAFDDWDESIRRLNEFLRRQSTHPEAVARRHEARYLLAAALRYASERPRRQIEAAETETARQELHREVRSLLLDALQQYQRLQAQLLDLEERDMLDPVDERLLRNCFFEIAHTHFALALHAVDSPTEDYERAIAAYNNAANKYPRDPQVLLAYLQMTNCYQRLDKPVDARGMLEQAKVVLKQIKADRFGPSLTNMTKEQWEEWIQWAQQVGQFSDAGPGFSDGALDVN